jgi:RNA polymerase sigma-70 factor (ECF subfamily)
MSFKEIYYRYYPELVRYGRQLNVNKVDIDDLVQETFMKYHIELSKDVVIENTRAWLYKVLLNQLITRNNSKSLHESKIKHYRKQNGDNNPIESIEKKERDALVFQVLDRLPDKEKNLLLLYHHGLKYREIAEVLDMNPNSVGKLLVRSIARLKQLLKTDYHELFG